MRRGLRIVGLRNAVHFFIYVGCGAFTTWLTLSVAVALLNIPNYGAKLAGQTCNCKVPDNLIAYVDVGGLMIGLGVFIPALLFVVATIYLLFHTRSKRSLSLKAFAQPFIAGVIFAIIFASLLLLQLTPTAVQNQTILSHVEFYPINIRLLNGTVISVERLERTVIIEFFLPECPICELQLTELKKVADLSGNGVIYFLIVPTWSHSSMEDLATQKQYHNMLAGYDVSSATEHYEVEAVPALLILDPNHTKALIYRGLMKESEIITLLSTFGLPIEGNVEQTVLNLQSAAKQDGSLMIYVEDPLEVKLIQQLAEEFKAKYPDITVTILWPNCCGPGKISWVPDVITGSDMSTLENLKVNGRLRALGEISLETFPEWAKDVELFWVAQSIKIDISVYNEALIDKPPSSIAEILKWCNNAVIAKPDHTVRDAPFVALTELYGLEYWRSFQNSTALVTPILKVADILAAGEKSITPYLPLPEYIRARNLNPKVTYFVPEEGVFARLSWIALLSDSPHPNAGKLWIHYVLSQEGQLLRQNIYYELSARLDVEKPQEFTSVVESIYEGKVLQPDWDMYKSNSERYISDFEKIFTND